MSTRIQVRRGTTAQWAAAAPVVLAAGEPGLDTDLDLFKIGDGATAWSALPVANSGTSVARLGGTTPTTAPLVYVNAKDYGVVGDNIADDTAAMTAWLNDAKALKVVAVLPRPSVKYLVSAALPTIDTTTVSVMGDGSGSTEINYTGTGDCFRVKLASFVTDKAGWMAGITVTGTSAAVGAGVHMGDIIGFGFRDVRLRGFTNAGGSSLWIDNTTNFTEQTWCEGLRLENSTKLLRFTVNGGQVSHSYNRWTNLHLNVESGQIGVSAENASFVNGNVWLVTFNVEGGVGNTASVVTLSGTAQITGGYGSWLGEQTSGTGAKFLTCPAGTVFLGDFFVSKGTLGHSAGGTYSMGHGIATYSLGVNGPLAIDASLMASGEVVQIVLSANATSTTVSNPATGQIITVAVINTGAFTMVWPANFLFAGGTAPAQAAAGNRTQVTMYSDGGNWFEMARAVNAG